MKLIDRLNNSAIQKFTLSNIDDGSNIECQLRYLPTQRSWIIDVSTDTFDVTGLIVTVSPNFLRQWNNIINFGIAATTTDGQEILFLDDFQVGRASLYLLSAAEVESVEDNFA